MFANRISFAYNFQGPSFAVDTACASSLCAMNQAVLMMRTNQCDAAIVCGANVCLNPMTSYQFFKMKMLDAEGQCKPFDASATGYCRSETIGVTFLQRQSQARRIYATISHIKTNTDGAKEEGITFPSKERQAELMEELYEEAQIDPLDVHYVEAHGTGTKAGDPEEANAIATVFCKNRTEPLLIGSVKGNIGHAEPGSGIGALGKAIISMKEGIIPPNINYSQPNPDIEPLITGKMKVITEPTSFVGEYIALNNFGFGGVNVHILLKAQLEEMTQKRKETMALPRLVLWCDRTEDGVVGMLEYISKNEVPEETFGFLQNLSKRRLMNHRGYTLLKEDRRPVCTHHKKLSVVKHPVWFVFSGMGTQWPGMGKDLFQIETFAKSIYHSAEVLKPYGIDLMNLFTKVGDGSKNEKREVIPAFVTIAAIQVALVDVLNELEIKPDGIVGHSVGELGCAYADGCLTAEQMVLSAYWRGKSVEESGLIAGAMAAVGLTWEETKNKCPPGVLPACNNSEDTVTVSGPVDQIKLFVEQLKSENIFVREVDSCGYAFHCSYVNPAASYLQKSLEKLIPNPKPRSHRWVCSSIPESNWDSPLAKYCSASYLVNNLVSSVLFKETLLHVPSDAVVIEIGPHCLLQAILRRSLSDDCVFITLMNKKEKNNLEYLLASVGNMYTSGLDPAIEKLYPNVTYPVPKSVPMIAPFITWDHSQSWCITQWDISRTMGMGSEFVAEIDISSPDSADYFLVGHCIDGRILFPAAGYLMLVWKALAKRKGKEFDQMPVEFEDFCIHRATILSKTAATKFHVSFLHVSGEFEVNEGGNVAASGRIKEIEKVDVSMERFHKPDPAGFKLDTKDIYKELRLRGYEYGPTFQTLIEAESSGAHAKLKWTGKWEAFLDGLLQISVFTKLVRGLFLPTRIRSISIDPRILTSHHKEDSIPLFCNKFTNECVSLGICMKGLKATIAPRRLDLRNPPILEKYNFVPHYSPCILDECCKTQLHEYIAVCTSLAIKIFGESVKYNTQIKNIITNFTEPPEKIVQSYTDSTKDNFVILNGLKELSQLPFNDTFHEKAKDILNKIQLNLCNDLISTALLSEETLRTTLDLVIENFPLKKMKVLEICEVNTIKKHIDHFMLDFNILFNTDYTVTCPKPDKLDEKIKAIKWDLTLPPPAQLSNFDLVIAKDIDSKRDIQKLLEHMMPLIKDNGFVLIIQRTKLTLAEKILSIIGALNLQTKFEEEVKHLKGASLVCKKEDDIGSSLYLIRKIMDHTPQPRIVHIQNVDYSWVEELKGALYKSSEKDSVWLIAEDCTSSGVIGMVNCLRKETEGDRIRCFFNASKEKGQIPPFNLMDPIYQEMLKKDLVMNVYKDGQWGSFRHTSLETGKTVLTDNALVSIRTLGDLSTLYWSESPTKFLNTSEDDGLIYVYYSALNFKDIMLATGRLPPDAIAEELALEEFILGMEYSGRKANGRRIMGLLQTGKGLATKVVPNNDFHWNVPDNWTLEEACTVPVAYSTAYYALILRGNLQKGEKILIHSGSGGVGQAAITIALHMGCEVYTSVGSTEKRNFLKERFPQLTDRHFCNSRDTSFEQHILCETNGEGVNVILNSLSEEKLHASVRCLARHGRFLEIGKYDSAMNNSLGMEVLLKNISFNGIHLDQLMADFDNKKLIKLMEKGLSSGVVQPLKFIIYERDEIEQAFRFMASGRHIGKILIKLRDEEREPIVPPKGIKIPAVPRTVCNPEKVYIVCGGLGGFGLELASWLIVRGAKNLLLTSRSGVKSGYQRLQLKSWKHQGVNVVVSSLDVSDYSQASNLIKKGKQYGDIGGIFNLAVVLKDGFLENLSEDDYKRAAEPKVNATYNLDKVSRKSCPNLDWFVVFSSVSCGRGNAGQSNYGFANSVMERICEERKKDGFPGLAIQWGAVGDVGLVFESMGGNDVEIGGTLPQRINSCLSTLDIFLQQDMPVVSSLVPAKRLSKDTASGERNLLETVANIFGIKDTSTLNPSSTLGELGMDSLMGVEIKQSLEREYDIFLSIQEIRMLTIKQLIEIGEQGGTDMKLTLKLSETSKLIQPSVCKYLVQQQCVVQMNNIEEGQPLFIIPSLRGTIDDFSILAENLSCPVYGLQITPEVPQSNIKEVASYYCDSIKSKLQHDNPCYILGCSNFGSTVALEIAVRLQNRGYRLPKLFILDSMPVVKTTSMKFPETTLTNSKVTQEEMMCSFIQQFVNISHEEMFIQDIMEKPSMNTKLQYLTSIITVATEFRNRDDVMSAIESSLNRLNSLNEYNPAEKFRGSTVWMTPSENISIQSQLGRYFGTTQICDGDIKIYKVKGDDSLLSKNAVLQVASIISNEKRLG